jgi:anhydro-N-acetylmuramic acid kinase
MPELYIGLISGTSMDGVDAALLDCTNDEPRLLATHAGRYSPALRRELDTALLLDDPRNTLPDSLDSAVGEAFAQAACTLLARSGVAHGMVTAIGSHGQTIRHAPDANPPYSLQIGDPHTIARRTGIDVVADFRTADMAAGGQGAPLVPAFHAAVFSDAHESRVVLNIGGIANITILPDAATGGPVRGFDTGPGNTLMDVWATRHLGQPMDSGGRWAAGGRVDVTLLETLLADPYFRLPPPKSTGREYFNADWLAARLGGHACSAQDVQATLCELTARSIASDIRMHAPATRRVLVCGGGAHNPVLMERLAAALPGVRVGSTALLGVDPDWVEAATFAWLAQRHLRGEPGNIPSVTGACAAVVLGRLFRRQG